MHSITYRIYLENISSLPLQKVFLGQVAVGQLEVVQKGLFCGRSVHHTRNSAEDRMARS